MATPAHCIYCFETLHAALAPPSTSTSTSPAAPPALPLERVQELWERYTTRHDNARGEEEVEEPSAAQLQSESRSATAAATAPALLAPSPAAPAAAATASSRSPSSTPSSRSSTSTSTKGRLALLFSSSASPSSNASSNSSIVPSPQPSSTTAAKAPPPAESPLFVTWNILHAPRRRGGSPERSLRGCIGTFEPLELEEGLRSYALTSAFQDTRFHPISPSEFNANLEVSVTLLTDFEPCAGPLDWEVGVHGIRIAFSTRGRRYGSTFLPSVATEQGWGREETLGHLVRKAGWSGGGGWKGLDVRVTRYRGEKRAVSWAEWREWRDWCEEMGVI